MVTVTPIGNNSEQPSDAHYLYNPDQLIAGGFPPVTKNVTLKAGTTGQIIKRGTVVGAIGLGAATSAAKAGGNTGNGTSVPDVTTPVLANAVAGVYTARFLTLTSIQLIDPTGIALGTYAIGGATGNAVTISNRIKLAITQGATPFAIGDGFDITVAVGTGKVVPAVKTATDGSAIPIGITVDDTVITADAIAGIYQTGEFNRSALIKDASYTLAELEVLFRDQGIFFKSVVSATDPT